MRGRTGGWAPPVLGALALAALICTSLAGPWASAAAPAPNSPRTTLSPDAVKDKVQHIVVFYQENHSFDNVLGEWCVQTARCDGTELGIKPGGETFKMPRASDI